MALSAGSVEIRLFAELARLQSDMKKANRVVEDAMGGIQKTVRATSAVFNQLAGAFGSAQIIKLADDYKRFDAQLKLSTKSLNEYNEAYSNVIRIGRTAQSDIGAIGVLYARLNNNLRDFNVTQNQVADVTETISLALRTNNATVQETNSVMLQLSQSFGSGKLNGQEFLAVAEGAPMLLRQLATSLKVPYGALKDLSAQGLITRDALLKAWSDPAYIASLREQVKQVGTVTSSITVLMNNLKQYIGESDKSTSATKTLSAGILLLADNINLLVTGAIAYGLVAFTKWVQVQYSALQASRAATAQKVIAAKVELSLAEAAYASGAAVTKQTAAMANNAAATTLATSNTARLIAAQRGLTAVTSSSAIAIKGLGTVLSMFGGWIGLAITAVVLFSDKLVQLGKSALGITPMFERIRERAKVMNDELAKTPEMMAKIAKTELDQLATERAKLQLRLKSQEGDLANLRRAEKLGFGGNPLEAQRLQGDIDATKRQLDATLSLYKEFVSNKAEAEKTASRGATQEQIANANKLLDTYKTHANLRKEYELEVQQVIEAGRVSGRDVTAQLALLKEQYDKATGATKATKQAIKDANAELKREGEVRKYLFDLQQELDAEATKRYNQAVAIRAKDDEEEYKRKSQIMKDLQKQANENYKDAQRAVEEQAREVERVNDRLYNNLARSLTDSIVRGFEQGLSFIDNFKQTIKNAFKSFVVNIGVNFAQQGLQAIFGGATSKLFAAIGGSLVSGNAIAGENSFNTKLLDGLSSLNTNVVGSIEKLGVFLANGEGGLGDTIGGFLGQYSNQIASGLAFAPAVMSLLKGDVKSAAFEGAGAGIGLALGGPVGGAIGAFLGGAVGGLFGSKKRTPRYSSGVSTTYENGNFSSTNLSRIAGFNKDAGGREGMANAAEVFSKSLGSLLSAFNINSVIKTNLEFFRRKGAWGFGSATVDGMQAAGTGRIYNKNQQAAYDEFINAFLTTGLVNAIKVSKLPEGLKSLFDDMTDRTQLGNMIQAVINLGNAQDKLTSLYSLTADQAGKVATATGLAGDELIAFVNKLASVAIESRTVGEALILIRDGLKTAFGGTMYSSLSEFDSALKSIDKSTQAGIESFAELFQLREDFVKFQSAIDGLKGGVKGALYDIVSGSERQAMLSDELDRMFGELNLAVPTSLQELIDLGKSIDYTTAAGLNLAAAFPSLVKSFTETESVIKSLSGTLNASYFTTRADMLSAGVSDNPRAFVKGQDETNSELLAEIKQMKADNADLKAIMAAVVEYTRQQQRIIDDWDVNGMPEVRTI